VDELQRDADDRDKRRAELNRERALFMDLQGRVRGQVATIDRLSAVIDSAERQMIDLKGKYESSVESRNYAGIQLIDRNDELCILYEKNAVQEEAVQRGEQRMRELDELLSTIQLQTRDVGDQLRVAIERFPQMPVISSHIIRLRADVAETARDGAQLSAQLEDPAQTHRWRPLEGVFDGCCSHQYDCFQSFDHVRDPLSKQVWILIHLVLTRRLLLWRVGWGSRGRSCWSGSWC